MVTLLKFIILTTLLFTSLANATPVITLSADNFSPGESILIKVTNLPGNPQDWLTLVKVDAPASIYGEWSYTKGVTEGSWTFSAPKRAGDYEVRVFFDYPAGGETIHARAPVKVEEVSTTESTKVSANTASEEKKQVVKTSTPTETSSAATSIQSTTVTETTASQHSDVDIIGLKLGMTQDQVMAVLKKHNKDVDITFSEFKVTANERKQMAEIPDHVTAINAAIGDARYAPYEIIIIRFSSPPSNNTVNEIVRSVRFAQDILTDTVATALIEKYGTPPKKGLFIWGNDTNNAACHMMPSFGFGNQDHFYDPQCSGLEVRALVDTSKKTIGGLKAVLIDHGEIKKQMLATNNYRAQLKEERRQAKLKEASQGSAPTL